MIIIVMCISVFFNLGNWLHEGCAEKSVWKKWWQCRHNDDEKKLDRGLIFPKRHLQEFLIPNDKFTENLIISASFNYKEIDYKMYHTTLDISFDYWMVFSYTVQR